MNDLTGKRFGRLTAQWPCGLWRHIKWLCLCDCGTLKFVFASNLAKLNHSNSCGCLRTEQIVLRSRTHGHASVGAVSREFATWAAMLDRCYNPNNKRFMHYGGREIKVCERWKDSFSNFLADMGSKPIGLTIDRINNDGDYEPTNCRWATHLEQRHNRRNPLHWKTKEKNYVCLQRKRWFPPSLRESCANA